MNDDGWHTLLAAGVDRNIVVYDSDAMLASSLRDLVSLMKTVMRRNGGGNSASNNRGSLTDLYVSPEAMEDIRNWGVDQLTKLLVVKSTPLLMAMSIESSVLTFMILMSLAKVKNIRVL